jgi:hypothetical protein
VSFWSTDAIAPRRHTQLSRRYRRGYRPGKAYAIAGNVQEAVATIVAPLDASGFLITVPKWRPWKIVVDMSVPQEERCLKSKDEES